MKTYIIQFFKSGSWHNLCSEGDSGETIEFLSLTSAKTVLGVYKKHYREYSSWQIKDSHGKIC
jgi:hypothetical protein